MKGSGPGSSPSRVRRFGRVCDLRCPMEQAEQLFVALKRLRREVVLVRFPDENHELSRTGRPCHRLERFRIILDWFGRHLGAPAG